MRHLVEQEAVAGDLVGLPTDLVEYYWQCFEQVRASYGRCGD